MISALLLEGYTHENLPSLFGGWCFRFFVHAGEFPNFPLEKFTVKFITMKSARGHSYRSCELALEQLASKRFPLELVTTHRFGLKDVDKAIKAVGGEGVPDVIHASLIPWE